MHPAIAIATTTNTATATATATAKCAVLQTPDNNDGEGAIFSPWSAPALETASAKGSSSRFGRFRQHVNPLSRRYQMPTELPHNWPRSDFADVDAPLYLDIGCGKGGFLLELVGRRHGHKHNRGGAKGHDYNIRDDTYMNHTKTFEDTTSSWLPRRMNYLGLEIRPGVSRYSRARAEKRGLGGRLSFVGCNANVDLERLLSLYQASTGGAEDASEGEGERDRRRLAFVSIQFPDPHFKKKHAKRGVVTPGLVRTLAAFTREGGAVFLQSDIKAALEAMRDRFLEGDGAAYFEEWEAVGGEAANAAEGGPEKRENREYGMENPLGIPTEREVSVLNQGLPIYRTLFKRNGVWLVP